MDSEVKVAPTMCTFAGHPTACKPSSEISVPFKIAAHTQEHKQLPKEGL